MTKKEFQELLQKHLDGRCNEEEKRLLKKFYDDFQTDNTWDIELGNKAALEEDLLVDINKKIERREKEGFEKLQPARLMVWRLAAVVTVALIAGAGSWLVLKENSGSDALARKVTQSGQKFTLVLADGTQIRLNSESSLSYPETFDGNTREVILEGEAFFDVAHDEDRPFIIRSGSLVTTVLGTAFNIKAFADEQMAVTVVSGKVSVHLPVSSDADSPSEKVISQDQGVFLTPGHQAILFKDGSLKKRKVNTRQYTAWKEGFIKFKDTPMNEAAAVLERWYGVDIIFESEQMKHCVIENATYEDQNLYNILESMKYFLNFDFKVIEGKRIIIDGKGCSPGQSHEKKPDTLSEKFYQKSKAHATTA